MNMDVDWDFLLFTPSLVSAFAWFSLLFAAFVYFSRIRRWWYKWKYIIGTIQRAHRENGIVSMIDVIPVSEKWMQTVEQMCDEIEQKKGDDK